MSHIFNPGDIALVVGDPVCQHKAQVTIVGKEGDFYRAKAPFTSKEGWLFSPDKLEQVDD